MSERDHQQVRLMDAAHVSRTLERMTLELYEQHEPETDILLVGIDRKGYALAQQIASCWQRISDDAIPTVQWHVKEEGDNTSAAQQLSGDQEVVLIDDVIFSGGTMMQALRDIVEQGPADRLMTLTLVDRGHRKWPILANIVGKRIPTKLNEHVEVIFSDDEHVQEVQLQWLPDSTE
jgi:pyrimidine operon attenuation protein/uracil phosphoribosyltransferase